MFTQCSNCNTVFELSAEVLRAAGGQVRCGRCGEIFNALARLAEDANTFDTGESAYEMEERADSILESIPPEPLPPMPSEGEDDARVSAEEEYGSSEIAQLQVLDFSDESFVEEGAEAPAAEPDSFPETALEFTLPPGELDRIFVESSVGVMPPFSALGSLEPPEPDLPHNAEAPLEPKVSELVTFEVLAAPETAPSPASVKAALVEDEEALPDIEIISDHRRPAVQFERSPLAELGAFDLEEAPPRSSRSFGLWLAAAIVAALGLLAQVVHHNREALTARGPFADALRALYANIGAPLGGAPNLAAFQLRQWGVTGDAAGESTLRVRASILNTSPQLQPFPLLRVTLANRFGTRIGTRDFEPSEYAGKPIARQLSPGEKVDAVLNILDPGKEAEGFEIDVCLPGGEKKVVCANDAAPTQARQ